MISIATFFLLGLSILKSAECDPTDLDELGPLNVYQDKVTLSGFSSGGTFAQQLQFSYSSMFLGIAVFSHTYYRCGNPTGNITEYDVQCTRLFNSTEFQIYDPELVHKDIQNYERRELIETTENLRNKRLYVYTGLRSFLFTPRQSLNIIRVYEPYIRSTGAIFSRIQDAELVMPTNSRTYGSKCTESNQEAGSYFIAQCGFSAVTEALNFILFYDTNFNPNEPFVTDNIRVGRVSKFNQREFTTGIRDHFMDTEGYYYVPSRCKPNYSSYNHKCYLHFYFHGCLSGRQYANDSHVANTGLLQVAEKRNIIMIFPQALSSKGNDIGCWDTFGISGRDYATKNGAQVRVVKKMLDKILGHRHHPSSSSSSYASSSSSSFASSSGSGYYGGGSSGYGSSQYKQGSRSSSKTKHG